MNRSTSLRIQRLTAGAVIAAPGVVALAVLAVLGHLDWRAALAGAAVVVAGGGLILWRHFRGVDALAKTASEALRRQQLERRQLEAVVAGNDTILANLPDPLITLDRARRIVRANSAAHALLGAGLVGGDLSTALRNPAVLEAADAVLGGEVARIVEFSLTGRLERFFWAKISDLPGPAPDGTVAILSLHDMTGARRAEKLRADFVANASHELRTPLASLLGFIETLSGPARDDETARVRFLTIMQEQARRMTLLVEDLLSLSRIEMQEHMPPDARADLERVLRGVAGALEMKARDKDMTIEVALDHLPPIIGDRDELAQVFENLIDNAVKYGRAGTAVRVTAGPSPDATERLGRDAVAVAVSDQGEGIAREHLPRLTERFYRIDTARSREMGGTGLGLAIVKHIVNRHRGTLEIASEAGSGSTFAVYLPTASREAAAE